MPNLSAFRRKTVTELFSSLSIMGMRVSMLAAKFLLGLFIVRFIGLQAMGIFGLLGGTSAIVQMVMRGGVFSNLSRRAVGQTIEELTTNLRFYATGVIGLYLFASPFVFAAGWYFNMLDLVILSLFVIIFEHICMDIFILTNNLHRPTLANIMLSLQSSFWIYLYMGLAFFYPELRTLNWVFAFWICGGIIATTMAAVLTRHWPWKQAFVSKLHFSWYVDSIKSSWRIYIAEILGTVTIYLDRYLINIFLSLELVGVYVLFWQVINAICNLVGAGVLQVYRPRLIAAYHEKNHEKFRKLFRESGYRSLASTAFLSIGSAIVVPFLVRFTKESTAMEYLPLLWLMLFSLLFRIGGDICSYTLYAQHRDDYVLHSCILKLIVSLCVGILVMNFIGVYGVALTAMATGSVTMLYSWLVWREQKG